MKNFELPRRHNRSFLWAVSCLFALTSSLGAQEKNGFPPSEMLINSGENILTQCARSYQDSYQSLYQITPALWNAECQKGKGPEETLKALLLGKTHFTSISKRGKNQRNSPNNTAEKILAAMSRGQNFNALYDGGQNQSSNLSVSVTGKVNPKAHFLLLRRNSASDRRSQILYDFEKRLDVKGSAQERKIILDTLSRISHSPTARTFMKNFIADHGNAAIRFDHIDGAQLDASAGHKTVIGIQGETGSLGGSKVEVILSDQYLRADADWRAANLVDTLAHELLGHGVEIVEAQQSHSSEIYNQTSLDEREAFLVGWNVGADLRAPIVDPEEELYAKDYARHDLQSYLDDFHLEDQEYLLMLDPQDSDPVAVYQHRKSMVKKMIANEYEERRDQKIQELILKHLRDVHGIDSLGDILSRTLMNEKETTDDLHQLVAMDDSLTDSIAHFKTPAGKKEFLRLKAAFKTPFFRRLQSRVDDLSRSLVKNISRQPMFDYGDEDGDLKIKRVHALWVRDLKTHSKDCSKHFKDILAADPGFDICQ